MSSRHRRRAQIARHVQQVAELHRLIAADAGNRRLATQIGVGKFFNHLILEPVLIVQDVVRNANGIGGRAGIVNILARTTGPLLLNCRAVVVELESHADHIIAGPRQQCRRNGGVDSAGHGRNHPATYRQTHRVACGRNRGVCKGGVHRRYVAAKGHYCE